MDAAQRFFRQAHVVAGQAPERVTTDGHSSYLRAIRETFGEHIEHRCSRYLNNRIEQGHRAIKQRYYPMRGFGSFEAAARFCQAFDELRQYERYGRTRSGKGSLAERRQQFVAGTAALQVLLLIA
jgi:putative transposase